MNAAYTHTHTDTHTHTHTHTHIPVEKMGKSYILVLDLNSIEVLCMLRNFFLSFFEVGNLQRFQLECCLG